MCCAVSVEGRYVLVLWVWRVDMCCAVSVEGRYVC